MTTLILKKRGNYNEKDLGYRLLLKDGFNGLYISNSSCVEKRIELSRENYEDFKIVANIYQDGQFVARFTGIVSVEDYEGKEVFIND